MHLDLSIIWMAHPACTSSRCLQLLLLLLLGCLYFTACGGHRRGELLRLDLQHRDDSVGSRKEEIQHRLSMDVSRMQVNRKLLTSDIDAAHQMIGLQTPLVPGLPYDSGGYLVDFTIGTPPRTLRLVVDTGSDLLWTQCQPCMKCYQQLSPVFQPTNSASYFPVPCTSVQSCQRVPQPEVRPACSAARPQPCTYSYRYADGSSSTGTLSTETVTLNLSGGSRNVRFPGIVFGCGNSNGGTFGRADGVLGLGQGPLSFVQQIRHRFGSEFAYCLMDFSARPSTKSVLIFGEDSGRLLQKKYATPQGEMQYTGILYNPASPPNYYVSVAGILVNGRALPIDPSLFEIDADGAGGTMFDSGVTVTYFAPLVYREICKALEMAVQYPRADYLDPDNGAGRLDLCFHAAGPVSKLKDLPLLSIVFAEGSIFSPPLANLFVDVGDGIKCLAMSEAVLSSNPVNILGNLFQQNFLMVHDLAKRSIGFARADCSSLRDSGLAALGP